MTEEKFIKDVKILIKFLEVFCKDKHERASGQSLRLVYRGKKLEEVEFCLCKSCEDTLMYSYERLQECPHEEKPRCRKCKNPCYERPRYRALAKIMRYSGMKLGLTKVKKFFNKNSN